MDTQLGHIQAEMERGQLTPGELAEFRVQLAGLYAHASGLIEVILMRKPAIWNEMRKGHKSDKSADREYEATQDGLDEVRLRLVMKRIEKMISSCKTAIDVATGEARNQF